MVTRLLLVEVYVHPNDLQTLRFHPKYVPLERPKKRGKEGPIQDKTLPHQVVVKAHTRHISETLLQPRAGPLQMRWVVLFGGRALHQCLRPGPQPLAGLSTSPHCERRC